MRRILSILVLCCAFALFSCTKAEGPYMKSEQQADLSDIRTDISKLEARIVSLHAILEAITLGGNYSTEVIEAQVTLSSIEDQLFELKKFTELAYSQSDVDKLRQKIKEMNLQLDTLESKVKFL